MSQAAAFEALPWALIHFVWQGAAISLACTVGQHARGGEPRCRQARAVIVRSLEPVAGIRAELRREQRDQLRRTALWIDPGESDGAD